MTNLNGLRLLASTSVFTLLIASASAASGQSTVPPASSDPVAADQSNEPQSATQGAGNEIIITAQKRSQRLQDVPISVTALTGAELNERGVTTTEGLAKLAPSVLITEYGSAPTVTSINIRGVAQLDYADHQESPNALYLDGAYISFQGATGLGMFDVDRVEVLRGPQGLLFGRNATGGLIQIISRRPTNDTNGYGLVEYGSYNRVRLEGALNVPLAPTLSARFAFQFNRQDGYIKNDLGPDIGRDKTYNGRAQLRWRPSGNVDNIITLFGSKTPREPAGVYDIFAVAPNPANHGLVEITNGPLFTANCEALGYGTPPAGSTNCLGYMKPPNDGPFRISTPTTGFFKRSLWGITNTLNVSFGPTTLTSVTNYTKIRKNYKEDNDSTGDPLLDYFSNQDAHQFSQELRLAGNSGRLNWVTGIYYLKIAGDYEVDIDLPLFGFAIGNAYKHDVESYAAFGQGEYAFTDQLTVIAGARLTRDKKSIKLTSLCSLDADTCTAFNYAPTGTVVSGSYAKNDWSGKLQLVWKPKRDLMFYAGVNRGNKGASLLALAPPTPATTFNDLVVKPEVLTAYEVGFKSQMFNRRLTLNGDIFYYNYHNFQAYKFEGLAAVLFNAEARNYGAELEANLELGSGLSARLAGSLLHTKVKDVQLPDGTLRDQRSAYAPSAMLIGNLRKEFQASSGKFFAQGGFISASSRYFSTVNEPALKAGPYMVLDASVGYIAKDDRWDATLMVNNITNKAYPIYQAELASTGGYGIRSFAPPRWISLQLGYHF